MAHSMLPKNTMRKIEQIEHDLPVQPRCYRGIEFIQLEELPDDVKHRAQNTMDSSVIIKIKTETEMLHGCIQWNDFTQWLTSPE